MNYRLWLFVGIVFMVVGLVMGCESEDLDITIDGEKIVNGEETVQTSIVEGFSVEGIEIDISKEPAVTEEKFQDYLHRITHQKVYADYKRGQLKATPENIKFLIEILNREGKTYENTDYYREVLDEWKVGNFSNAVEVHNMIWEWEEGEGKVGRAIRLFTPEEEEQYLKENYRP